MIAATDLKVPVQTPDCITDINIGRLASDQGGSIAIISGIEGVLVPWDGNSVPDDIKDWFSEGFKHDLIRALVLTTNKYRNKGQRIASNVSHQLHDTHPSYGYWGESVYPTQHDRLRPSGFVIRRATKMLHSRENTAPSRTIVVGSTQEEMVEANIGYHEHSLLMAFMVAGVKKSNGTPSNERLPSAACWESAAVWRNLRAERQPQIYVSPSPSLESDT